MTVLRDIWIKTLWDNRRGLLGWAVGITAVTLVYGGFYPFVTTPAYAEAMEALPDELLTAFGWNDLTSPAGYLGSTVFGLLGPVLVIIFAIGLGTRAIAGDEEAGTLELLMTLPVTRQRIVVHRAAALVITMAMASALVFLALTAIRTPAEIDLPAVNLVAASLLLGLLGVTFGALAMLVGALTGRRGLALAVTAGVAVVTFLADNLASTFDAISWTQNLSPFHYYSGSEPLRHGVPVGDVTVLAVVCLALVAGTVVSFQRRDVGT
jgi:ABC-2 type transport system permease protein